TDPAGRAPLDELEAGLRGAPVDWADLIHGTKRAVADGILQSEVRRIVREVVSRLAALAPQPPASLEATVDVEHLRVSGAARLACVPAYRYYLPAGLDHVEQAFACARRTRPDLATTYDVLRPLLGDPESPPALRFQQTS